MFGPLSWLICLFIGWVLGLETADYLEPHEPANPITVDPPEPEQIRDLGMIVDERPRDVHDIGRILRRGQAEIANENEDPFKPLGDVALRVVDGLARKEAAE